MENISMLKPLLKRGSEFLGVEYPIICGAMTWVSEPKLVSAVANAGAFACLAGGNAPTDILRSQIEEVKQRTKNNFAVNLITIAPSYHAHLEMMKDVKAPFIVFAGSFPKEKEIEAAKATGAKVMCFASTESIAERMIRFGADAIILEGSEAGGHIGHVATTVLVQQVLYKFCDQIPIFVAGGIGTGKMMAHMLLMGAAGVQLGTRFVMTEESNVHPKFKEAFIRANARDAISTPQYDSKLPVVAVRALRNRGTAEFGALQLRLLKELEAGNIHRQEAQEEVEKFWIGALRRAAVDGDIEMGSLMAGQSVGLVDKVLSIGELLTELLTDAEKELAAVRRKLGC
ncbi:NAD(P)H-dependent flavin oxidoreductase [Victivallis vadensis]|uniref:Enoyl-[acyl-carrier protein] reductase II n=3 Tax=Victivallis vadensis TaxID=172901 RepID=A0A2U1AT15_9BACT|nr:nitronate monooxygenase [Victivallis vadensis]PVY39548.1 enoyl-[acyl-carrier protein] reductase II [Victivallis vadensis]HJH02633.1 nitronate monooxygenase [Victivallis vadensis]